jgi:hypothetical protein
MPKNGAAPLARPCRGPTHEQIPDTEVPQEASEDVETVEGAPDRAEKKSWFDQGGVQEGPQRVSW